MAVPPPQRFVILQLLLMLAILSVLLPTVGLRLDIFLISAFAGFIILGEFTSPFSSRQPWRVRLRWVTVIGYVLFFVYVGYVTYLRLAGTSVPSLI